MRLSLADHVSLAFVVAGLVGAALLYDRLPDLTPVHWAADGEADGFAAKPWGPFVLPLVAGGVWLVMFALPFGSERLRRSLVPWRTIQVALSGALFLTIAATWYSGLGSPLPTDRIVMLANGMLFVVIGNVLGKTRQNAFLGVRTPWTLASEDVWFRTHRFAGWAFVLAGLGFIAAVLTGQSGAWGLWLILAAALGSVIYSYVAYRQLKR